ncbi:S8 family serine peptidase [Clostridium sp. Marseille-Q2269]|uniref:S8 family serine peptidase n=1 Tax=Clostridium sp. Marseille-Q2269 TaxID=2942205 RepID=UPI00207384F4|nr:S8 family serine peptidase [Clostridium sp. Marseille-Q2269]
MRFNPLYESGNTIKRGRCKVYIDETNKRIIDMHKIFDRIENINKLEYYNLLNLREKIHGKLTGYNSEDCYIFTPKLTGSYEIICNGTDKLCAAICNEEKTDYINSSCVSNVKSIRLATTLKNYRNYYIKINLMNSSKKNVMYTLNINYIEEPKNYYFKYQWGLLNKKNGLDINILPVWKYTTGNGVKIGIADTGTNYKHSDLINSINLKLSYNFVHESNDIFPENEQDYKSAAKSGHGTHIAGIIGASQEEKCGMVGIAPDTELISLKILGSKIENYPIYNDASDSFIKAIEYSKRHGIKIINCSFSGTKPSKAEREAMLNSKDILFIIAAGNSGVDLGEIPQYPACYRIDNSIVVAAIDKYGELYITSNYGGPTDIAAPGERILSTYLGNKYVYANATSSATPFVSAVCGLVWSLDNNLTPMDVKKRVVDKKNVTQLKNLNNKVLSGGILNAYKAVVCSNIETVETKVKYPYPKSILSSDQFSNKYMTEYIGQRNNQGNLSEKTINKGVNDNEYIGELIVKLNSEVTIENCLEHLEKDLVQNIVVKDYLKIIDAYVIKFDNINYADIALDLLNSYSEVKYVEPNYKRTFY